MNKGRITVLLFVAVIFVVSVSSFKSQERYFEIVKNLDIFATLFKEVNTYYVDEVNPNELMNAGIKAMLKSLDPYTNYISENEIEDYRTLTTGEYGGIGAIVGKRLGKNMIILPYKNFPAEKSGLKIGDEILQIDGIDISDKTTSEISKLLKGQAGTELTLTIQRLGEQEGRDVTLKREKITIDNVSYSGMVAANTGYIKLTDFTTNASKEVKKAMNDLKKNGANSIILDLRDNPGGLLNEAVNISNLFIEKGQEVVSTKGKVRDWNKTYMALDQPEDTNIPIAVLVNSRSASASEIVAGVIQDYDRGVLVGAKTFGKGLVQATRPLTYNSQLKVTTAKYYIPSGRCIQAIDYSNRNENGSVGKIPDSLKSEFKTKNGRIVYDGGGVDPDVEVKEFQPSPILVTLIAKGLLFEYASKFYLEHQTIEDPVMFELNDEQYDQFKTWLQDKDYDYTTKTENTLDELEELFTKEDFYDEIKGSLAELTTEIQESKENDLDEHKDEIKEYLEEEIVTFYYLDKGAIEASFDFDPHVKAAVQVLNNQEEYNSILEGSI
jgi:carboxyl-terminal processing protease